MKIIIFGGTGFIGSSLLELPYFQQHEVFIVTRHPEKRELPLHENFHFVKTDEQLETNLAALFSDQYAIINLAGESLVHWPWSKIQKQRILLSRVHFTSLISKLVNKADKGPEYIIQASAVGYYGFEHKNPITEGSSAGNNFLAQVCKNWEESLRIENHNSRVVFIRTGLVLGRDNGILELLRLPFYLFAGGPLGPGNQMMPWIHLDDELKAIEFLMKNEQAVGAFNLVAPEPVSMKKMMKNIGKKMNRPSWFPVPAFLLRIVLGKTFADELVIGSQEVVPEKLLKAGYIFKYQNIEEALSDLIETK